MRVYFFHPWLQSGSLAEDRVPLLAHPPSINNTLSGIQLDDINFDKDILAEQIAMSLSWT